MNTTLLSKVPKTLIVAGFAVSVLIGAAAFGSTADAAGPTKKVFTSSHVSVYACQGKKGTTVRYRVQSHVSSFISRVYIGDLIAQNITPYGSSLNNGGLMLTGNGKKTVQVAYSGVKGTTIGSFTLKKSALPTC